jgi:hypothetical protein
MTSPRTTCDDIPSNPFLQLAMNFVFNILKILLHHGPGVNSASDRNEYQESSGGGVKGCQHVGLTTVSPSVSRLSRQNVGASTSHNPMGLHGLLQG